MEVFKKRFESQKIKVLHLCVNKVLLLGQILKKYLQISQH